MWFHVTGNVSLPGAHSTIVNMMAQCTIASYKLFWDFIDKSVSMIAMADVWAVRKKKRYIHDAELKRKIPTGWAEGETGSA
jgi:hypothetical protein